MKNYIILFFLFLHTIYADMVILKNDSVLVGRYVSEKENSINFQVFKDVISIPKNNIKKFRLGYSGVPVCYKKTKEWTEVCGAVIHQLDRNKIILGKGEGLLDKDEIELKSLDYIRIKKTKKDDNLLFVLRPGIKLSIKANGKTLNGEIKSISNNELILKEGLLAETKISENDIEELSWESSRKSFSLSFIKYLVPGVMQYQNGKKIKGIVMGTLFLGFIGGAVSQFNASKKALNEDVDYLIIGNNIYIGSNIFPNPEYEKSINNMRYALGGLGILYMFHSYEVYSHVSKSGIKTSLKLNPFQNLIQQNNQNLILNGNHAIEVNFSFSF